MSHLIAEVRAARQLPTPALAREIRRAAGVSRDRLAAELGVHPVTVTRWESGTRHPRGTLRVAYAQLLGQLAAEVGQLAGRGGELGRSLEPPGPPAERVFPLEHDAPALPRPDGRHRRTSDSSASEAVR